MQINGVGEGLLVKLLQKELSKASTRALTYSYIAVMELGKLCVMCIG